MKRIITLLLALVLTMGLFSGCGNAKDRHDTTEEVSLEMMQTLAEYMPQIAQSAKYEFKELNAVVNDIPIHLLFIVKERFNGINEGELWMDPWNIFVMDLDSGNVYHVKNRNYKDSLVSETSRVAADALWNYEYYCTGLWDSLLDENEVWTSIVTEEDFAALQQRSNCKLPEARNVLTVEKAEKVNAGNTRNEPEMNVMYVQIRNHAAPMEEYQQEWYAIDLDRHTVYDSYDLENAYFSSMPEDAMIYLSYVRHKFSSRVYDGFIFNKDLEVWDTMLDVHLETLNQQLLTSQVPQPLNPVPQSRNTYTIEGFSEYQNMLASLLSWYGMEDVSAISAMEYTGTIPQIDGGDYHLLFLSTDAPKGYHREDDLVIDLNTGYFYDSFSVDEGWPPLRYCEGIGMLLEGYSLFRDGQQSYIWSKNEKRTELLTTDDCRKLNEAARVLSFTEEEILQEAPTDEQIPDELVPDEQIQKDWDSGEMAEETFEEAPQDTGDELPWEPNLNPSYTIKLDLAGSNADMVIQAVNAYQKFWGNWSDTPVNQAMEYHVEYEDDKMLNLLLISTSHHYSFDGPWEGILLVDLDTGILYGSNCLTWPQTEWAVGKEEHIAMMFSGYDNLLNGADTIWSEVEEKLPLTQEEINTINSALTK